MGAGSGFCDFQQGLESRITLVLTPSQGRYWYLPPAQLPEEREMVARAPWKAFIWLSLLNGAMLGLAAAVVVP